MAESFTFSFSSDDIEYGSDERESDMHDVGRICSVRTETPQEPGNEPRLHKLDDLISILPSRISYSTIRVQGKDRETINIPHREIHDIRAQIMAEDETPEGAADGLASVGLSPDDIKPSIYEGGFKTWECSEDLATYVIGMLEADYNVPEAEHHIIELGAGTALSSCALLHSFLTIPSPSWRAIHLSFADYNISVIELATIPNLILTWYFAMNSETLTSEGDIDITPNLLAQFHSDLLIRRIYLSGISGMWNQAFSDLVRPFDDPQGWEGVKTTVLASETIYSPSSIGPFTEVVLNVLEAAAVTGERAKALVAAKQIYFGVGGGVDEFRNVLERRGGSAAVVWASEGSGVGRVILEVKGT